jgi:hypothetical protein
MGHSTEDQLVNRLGILLAHLPKWHYQPSHRGNSWRLAIAEQRRRIARLIRGRALMSCRRLQNR